MKTRVNYNQNQTRFQKVLLRFPISILASMPAAIFGSTSLIFATVYGR